MNKEKHTNLKCIFCLLNSENGSEHELTKEHIIPQVLGGWLTVPFVCKTCNNDILGSSIEGKLKKNGYIVSALNQLNIQSANLAYREANIQFDINLNGKLNGYFNKNCEPEYYAQQIEDESIITPENESKEVLRKKIKRFEKKTGNKVDFDINEFDNLPYGIVIPIPGTDISFIKHKNQKPTVTISGLDASIPMRIPAIIAFEHLAAIYYPFVLKKEFDPIRNWIINKNENHFVILNSQLEGTNPDKIKYLPYHYVKFGLQDGGLSAIVVLFGTIKYLIFLAELESFYDFPHPEIFDYYHIYNVDKKEFYIDKPPPDIKKHNELLLSSVTNWGITGINKQ